MPDGNNYEATKAMNGDEKTLDLDNEKLSEAAKIIDEQKEEKAAQPEQAAPDSINPAINDRGDSSKRSPYRTNRPARSGASANGTFDSKESQRHSRYRKKVCRFCLDKKIKVNYYRDSLILGNYVTERGKILPRRITGTCSKHQREVSKAIKRARILAVLPFTVK